MVVALEQKLMKGRGFLVQLSCRGHVLMLNNLVASMLWHRFKAVHPPESLVKNIQRILIDFLWSDKHRVQPGVLSLPLDKGGQGLADLISKIMAFRMTAIKRLLHGPSCLASRFLANSLLSQAGALGYSQDVFLIDVQHLDLTQLPSSYSSRLNAW